jgi:hypothetical protein
MMKMRYHRLISKLKVIVIVKDSTKAMFSTVVDNLDIIKQLRCFEQRKALERDNCKESSTAIR